MLLAFAAVRCTTDKHGQLKPVIIDPQVAIPVAIANKALGRSKVYLVKIEIMQNQKYFRPYPLSRLKAKMKSMEPVDKEFASENYFYPVDTKFSKEMTLDNNTKCLIQLIYEPTGTVLDEQKVSVKDPMNVLLKISCQPTTAEKNQR